MPTIFTAQEEDLPSVRQLFAQWESEASTWGLSSETAEQLRGRLGDYFLVLRQGEQLVGFNIATQDSDGAVFKDKGPFLFIEDLYVSPPFRGRNHGRRLMEAVISAARANGIHRFSVFSGNKEWQRIVKYYAGCGFKVWNIQMYYEDDTS